MMQETLGPCVSTPLAVHIITATGTIITSCFAIYLAHRRIKKDRVDSMRFMDQRVTLDQIQTGVQETNRKLNGEP